MNLIKMVNVLAKVITRITNVGRGKVRRNPITNLPWLKKTTFVAPIIKSTAGFVVLNNFRHVWTDVGVSL